MTVRYAVYLAPVGTLLWRLGSAAIGYDAEAAVELAPSPPPGVPEDVWRDWTAEPARYGFHATLKAPFELREDRRESDLDEMAATFAATRRAASIPRLAVELLGSFAALVPAEPSPAAHELAAAAVEAFEPCRAPLAQADRARRLAAGLTERQAAHLDRWGYPYVFEEFRLHLTLAGPLPEPHREPVRAALSERFAPLEPGLELDAVALFVQPSRTERFQLMSRHPFGG